MRDFLRRILLCFLPPLLLATAARAQDPLPVTRVGVVIDGPWERNIQMEEMTQREVEAITSREFDVRFPSDATIVADWSIESIGAAIDRLINDPEIDVVITWGLIGSDLVCRRSEFPKPVIAPVIVDTEIQDVPYKNGVSGVNNLSYVSWPPQVKEDIRTLYEIRPFKKLAILVHPGFTTNVALRANTAQAIQDLGLDCEFTLVPVGTRAEEAFENLPPDVDAVYVAALLQLPNAEFDRLAAGFIDRRLPTFSLMGRSRVEQGLLASACLDADLARIARRVALNLHRILRGEDPGELPVAFDRSRRLTINMATARAIGVYPSWSLLTEADLLNDERTGVQRTLTLSGTVREAVGVNLDLKVVDRLVAAGQQDVALARSVRLPQVGLSALSFFIDKDRAEGSLGTQGRWNLNGSASLAQLVYSEDANANIGIQEYLQESRLEARRELRLDVIQEASTAYLNVLRAKTQERIEKENLRLTRDNLEIARARQRVGVAHPSEVYRWESSIAANRGRIIRASARRNQAEIAVNRLLNRPLEEAFGMAEAGVDDPQLYTTFAKISKYVGDPWSFKTFRSFMVQEGLEASPELRRLEAGISAQRRAFLAARRAFWAPTVGVQGDFTARATKGGELDLNQGLPSGFFEGLTTVGNIDWSVGLSVDFPLFTGGAKRAELVQVQEELARLELERDSVTDRIEQGIRNTLHAAGASYANIQLARDAATAARRNLELVTEAYRVGVLSIQDLLDAQNASVLADAAAANAVYDYLIDLMAVQRSVGRFDFFAAPAQQQQWLQRLDTFFTQAAPPGSGP